ncbi:MAG: glycerate kinase [Actinobacteria bacterium]|uniref:Unannotated protein n=1 Tax=freshwater metagenome TaxID=449393 RepID=A0A6J6QJH6_9ZZZZ|nr:glycerate kinase [Actinomycetota bacterium]
MRVLACPDSLKGVLGQVEAAAALAEGVLRGGGEAVELPIADGGEGTALVLHRALGGEWRIAPASDPLGRPIEAEYLVLPDGTAVVESAAAAGLGLLTVEERDPLVASTAGLGELLAAVLVSGPSAVLVGIGGTATVDGGAGMRRVLGGWPSAVPLRIACDVQNPLLGERGAARVFGPQKGATPAAVEELERRLSDDTGLAPFAELTGAGAGGGLGAAFASLGGALIEGGDLVLDTLHFDSRAVGVDLVVTGEGKLDQTTLEGKAPGSVWRRCQTLGVPCVLFGGLVDLAGPDFDIRPLSGDPSHAVADLVALGEALAAASHR